MTSPAKPDTPEDSRPRLTAIELETATPEEIAWPWASGSDQAELAAAIRAYGERCRASPPKPASEEVDEAATDLEGMAIQAEDSGLYATGQTVMTFPAKPETPEAWARHIIDKQMYAPDYASTEQMIIMALKSYGDRRAEEMRERAAEVVERNSVALPLRSLAERIRALPLSPAARKLPL